MQVIDMKTGSIIMQSDIFVDWDRLEHLIHDRFEVNAVTFNRFGSRRTMNQLWANQLCELIKSHLDASRKICDKLQTFMLKSIWKKKRYVTGECDAGLYRRLFPVVQEKEIEGFIGVCGRPFSTRQLIYPEYICKLTGCSLKKLNEMIGSLKPIGPRHIKEMTSYIMDEGLQECSVDYEPLAG